MDSRNKAHFSDSRSVGGLQYVANECKRGDCYSQVCYSQPTDQVAEDLTNLFCGFCGFCSAFRDDCGFLTNDSASRLCGFGILGGWPSNVCLFDVRRCFFGFLRLRFRLLTVVRLDQREVDWKGITRWRRQ